MSIKPKAPFVPVVAVLNMKGGVGKTTLSANISRVLFERHENSILLLDLDPQFNLTQSLFKSGDYDKKLKDNKTIAQVFSPEKQVKLFEISDDTSPPPDPHSIKKTLWGFKNSDPYISLDIVPGDFSLVKYSLMNNHDHLKKVQDRFLQFVKLAKNKYNSIVIDCNPSSSFLTICALSACTHVLVPVKPDKYSILGLDMLWEFVHDILPISPKPEFLIVLNGVPRKATSDLKNVESQLRAHPIYGPLTLANMVYESGILRARTDFTGFATDRRVSRSTRLKQEMSNLCDEIFPRLGLKKP